MQGRTAERIAARPDATRAYRAAWLLCCAALLDIGVYTALLGPVLPDFARRAGVSLGTAGALFTALFSGALVSTVLAGRAMDRFGRRRPLALGLALNGAALLLLPWASSWPALLALAMLLGMGDGAVVVGVHVLAAETNPDNEAASLNVLNVFFGVGAVLGPAAGALVRMGGGRAALVMLAVGVAQLSCAVLLLSTSLPPAAHVSHGTEGTGADRSLLRSTLLWLLAALLLVYVGVELGLGGWAFTYAREAAGLGGTAATLLSSGFWLALTLGRLLSPAALRRMSPAGLLSAGSCLAAAAALALVVNGDAPAILVLGVLLAGLGFGPVWPVTFALAARAFPATAGSATGILAMVSALGAISLPWLQGRVLDGGGPTAGISVTLAACLLLIGLSLVVRRGVDLSR